MDNMRLKSIVSISAKAMKHDENVFDALNTMRQYGISSIVIVDINNFPIGIFTERDALKAVSQDQWKETPLENVMSRGVLSALGSHYLHDAYMSMEQHGYRHLVVVDENGKYIGVVSEGDFLRHMGFDHLATLTRVEDAMSEAPLSVDTKVSLSEVMGLMRIQRKEYVVVIEAGKPIRVITKREVIAHCMIHGEDHFAIVGDLDPITPKLVNRNVPLQEAAVMMKQHGVHQLIVVDSDNIMVGILDRHDILKALQGAYFEFLIRVIDQKSDALEQVRAKEGELRLQKEQSDKSELKFRKLFEALPDGCILMDESTTSIEYNDAVCKMLGYEYDEFKSLKVSDYEVLESPEETARRVQNIVAQGKDHFETRHHRKDGSILDVAVNVVALELEQKPHMIAFYHDITEQKKYQSRLEELANYDTLTGLANRALLLKYIKHSIQRSGDGQIALLMFDLDRFKDVNDSFGHSVGDELLQVVADRFNERLRDGDFIARLGGDEFAIVMSDLNRSEDVAILAEELIERLSVPYDLDNGINVHVGVSAGIALYPDHGRDSDALLQYADAALYTAKSEGRGVYRYYTDALTEAARHRIECVANLKNAIANGEFELYYQPQVHMATGKIVGAEALIRWHHPTRGMVPPDEFIMIAEESGLISTIGEWVIHEACRQGKQWLNQGHKLTIAVNVSPHQIRHQNVPKIVHDALKQSGFNAYLLEIELTESALMQREEETLIMLHTLRAYGIRLAIDDFGTGYSSFSYLKRFPIDVLKIDKSFIDDIPIEPDDMAITSAIITMGLALGFQVLAEGTESIEQIEFLKERGCSLYQGYYKSKPVPAAEFEKLLS